MSKSNTTEVAVGARIHQMEGECLIAKAFALLDHCSAQDLLGAHALCSRSVILYAVAKVLQNHVSDGRNRFKNLANPVQILWPGGAQYHKA